MVSVTLSERLTSQKQRRRKKQLLALKLVATFAASISALLAIGLGIAIAGDINTYTALTISNSVFIASYFSFLSIRGD